MPSLDAGATIYIVMGVAGAGKTRIGAALARALGLELVEGDHYHSAENVARMSAGIPLTDADRHGWLTALAARIREAVNAGTGLVVTCSALKRSYRDLLRAESGVPWLQFIFLRGDRALIAERIAGRRGHYMPASLLASQFEALEEPSPDERAWVYEVTRSPDDLVAAMVKRARS
ncbi:MAG TPA: gluconokinase [Gemmatimonadaceae bacterium]|jgi:gluconokinase|nr:gluconokinase [Gemmatimonadaceae bacterium]